MTNPIKYSVSVQTLALKKGDFYIGTNDVGKGPTSSTDYWNGITPPAGGYTIYLNKSTNGPSIYVASNDSDLIDLTNKIAGASYTTANECLSYFVTQTDKMVFNSDYDSIITSGLTFLVDAGFTPSYPKNNATWYDLSSNGNNITLFNSPTFSTTASGTLIFDGTNDYSHAGTATTFNITGNVTVCAWVRASSFSTQGNIVAKNGNGGYRMRFQSNGTFWMYANGNTITSPLSYSLNNWYYTVGAFTSSGLRMYINGSLLNSNSNAFNPNYASPSNFYIGSLNASGGELFNGYISNVSVYNRALSASEVLQNFNAQKARFGL